MGLQASLLVKRAESQELYVNLDPQVLTQIRETDCMSRMGLKIPPFASVLQQRQEILKKYYNKLQVGAGYSLCDALKAGCVWMVFEIQKYTLLFLSNKTSK